MKTGLSEDTIIIGKSEKIKFLESLFLPFLFVLLLWLTKFLEVTLDERFTWLGIYPKQVKGLIGIFTAPLIHADWAHLISNSFPLLILGTSLFYFYKEIALKSFFLIYIITGIWVWVGGREAWHIGASGLIYGLVSFMFLSGLLRRSIELMAISLVVVFLYGGLVWGIFPTTRNISWESHFLGGMAGLVIAFYYKNTGPQRKKFDWEDEEDDDKLEFSDNSLAQTENNPKEK